MHDRRDAGLIWELLMEDRVIWMPSTELRDLRTLLRDRHQSVKMRARLQHTLQEIALNHALRQGRTLWSAAGHTADWRTVPMASQIIAELSPLKWHTVRRHLIQDCTEREQVRLHRTRTRLYGIQLFRTPLQMGGPIAALIIKPLIVFVVWQAMPGKACGSC